MSWRLRNRLRKRAAFWHLTRSSLAVAVLADTHDEPLLVSCAWIEASVPSGGLFCPGILEAVSAAAAGGLPQVVGLGADFCSLDYDTAELGVGLDDDWARASVGAAGTGDPLPPAAVRVRTQGKQAWASAARRALDEVEGLFDAAGLELAVVDSEHCAMLTLGEVLGIGASECAVVDPLTAVSVAAQCEADAAAAGPRLCVPVGLALAWLGQGWAGGD